MRYDAIIIGSGQAGNPLAYDLSGKGWKVALIEKEHLGGTCVNVGCTPTKTMVASAQVAHYVRNGARWGVEAENVRVNMARVLERKNALVQRSRSYHEKKVAQDPNITLHRGKGRLTGPHQVTVEDQVLESDHIFLNTGTRATIPEIPGLKEVPLLDNASVMELTEVPRHLVVLGGGYIGLEFGQMYRRFGSQVTVIHHSAHLLSREDPDVAEELQKALEVEGLRFLLPANVQKVEKTSEGVSLTVESAGQTETVEGSHLLVATGRTPNTDGLNLDQVGVKTDKRGFVQVNERLETTAPGIWALGDVKGGPAFTHISYNDYQIVFANLTGGNLTTKGRPVPYAVFTDPQLGRVGMTEAEARATGRPLKIGKYRMNQVARALERDETAGVMKIVVDGETDQILGASILGVEGGETVQILGFLMKAGAPYTLLKGAVYIHPTLAEGFYGLMDSITPV